MPKEWSRALVIAALILAGAEFIWRGPVRGINPEAGWNDFTGTYLAARAFWQGTPPYEASNLIHLWTSRGGTPLFIKVASYDPVQARPIYPPTALAIFAPFAALPWRRALTLWVLAQVACVVILAVLLANDLPGTYRKLVYGAGVLALAPIHTGIAHANPAVFSIALGAMAVWASLRQRPRLAGLLLAASLCLKPPLGCALLLYYLVIRRDKRLVITCLAAAAVLALAAVGWLAVTGNHWWADLRGNLHYLTAPGTPQDITGANPTRFTLINLQVLFFAIYPSRLAANVAAYGLSAALAATFLLLSWDRSPSAHLLDASIVAVLSLLPFYHRSYEAAVLVLPLAWALASLHSEGAWPARISLALMAIFLIHGGALLLLLIYAGTVPPAVADNRWWNAIVMPHEIWALLGLSLVLLYARRMARQRILPAQGRVEA